MRILDVNREYAIENLIYNMEFNDLKSVHLGFLLKDPIP